MREGYGAAPAKAMAAIRRRELSAGIPLDSSLRVLERHAQRPKLKMALALTRRIAAPRHAVEPSGAAMSGDAALGAHSALGLAYAAFVGAERAQVAEPR